MISIIIPVYNGDIYITECLESIISQKYQKIEVIIVDDSSTDDTLSVIDSVIANYDGPINFRVICHDTNKGVSVARNTGLEAAKGDYIGFVDSDDYIAPMMFETLRKQMDNDSCNIGITMCGHMIFEKGQIVSSRVFSNQIIPSKDFAFNIFPWNISVAVWDKLFKRELIGRTKFREDRLNEDSLFFLDLLESIEKDDYAISIVPDILYYHRVSPVSLSRSLEHSIHIDNLMTMEEIITTLPKRTTLIEAMRKPCLKELLAILCTLKDSNHKEHDRYTEFMQKLLQYSDEEAKSMLSPNLFHLFLLAKYFPKEFVHFIL